MRLLVDDDGDFNSGATLIAPSSIDGTNNTATFTVDFTNGQYYTLGSLESAALPVTLISFTASNDNEDQVLLQWITAQETGNAFYTIEKSENGFNFEKIGTREGAGDSEDLITYYFTDTKPTAGSNYYRLKQTDFNGEFEYSEIIRLEVNPSTRVMTYSLYPNPVSKEGILTITQNNAGVANQSVSYEIVSISGKRIFSGSVITDKGKIQLPLKNQLPEGIYLIRLKSAESPPTTLRFIVQ